MKQLLCCCVQPGHHWPTPSLGPKLDMCCPTKLFNSLTYVITIAWPSQTTNWFGWSSDLVFIGDTHISVSTLLTFGSHCTFQHAGAWSVLFSKSITYIITAAWPSQTPDWYGSSFHLGIIGDTHFLVTTLLIAGFTAGAWSVLFSKSITYIITAAWPSQIVDWYSWFCVLAFIGSAAFWIKATNQGLRLFSSSLIIPLMQAAWTAQSIVEGGIYFDEFKVSLQCLALCLQCLPFVLAVSSPCMQD